MYNCQFCGKESKKPNLMSLRIHELQCNSNPNKNTNMKPPSRKGKYLNGVMSEITKKRKETKEKRQRCLLTNEFKCKFCEKDCNLGKFSSSFLSLICHESQCPSNPERVKKPCSEETREKLKKASTGKKFSNELREKLSNIMQKVVEKYPESYSHANRNRCKRQNIEGIRFDSSWEILFYQWAKSKEIEIQRCKTSFPYEWDKIRKYFPDFYLPNLDLYVEIKGYSTARDEAKWANFPHKLVVIRKNQIEEIKKGIFNLD
jgi:hypothetical protein